MRRIVVLGVLVAALGLYALLVELPARRDESAREVRDAVALHFDAAAVRSIRLEQRRSIVELAKDREGWRIVAPTQEPATDHIVEEFLRVLGEVARYRNVDESIDDPAPYGLTIDGDERVLMQLEGGDAPLSIEVGALNPAGNGVYYRELGSRSVDLAAADLHELVRSPVTAFRRTNMWDTADSTIVAFEVQRDGLELRARRDERRLWIAEDGSELQHWRVSELLHELARSRIDLFVAEDVEPEDFAEYGLRDEALSVSFVDEAGLRGRIRFGNEAERPGFAFARRDDDAMVLRVGDRLLELAQPSAEEWVDHNPIDENFRDLLAMELRWDDGKTIASRGRGHEQVTQIPDGSGVASKDLHIAMRNVYYGLQRIESSGSISFDSIDAARASLARWPVEIRLRWPGRERVIRLGVGDDQHWILLDQTPVLWGVERGLFFRLQGWLLGLYGDG